MCCVVKSSQSINQIYNNGLVFSVLNGWLESIWIFGKKNQPYIDYYYVYKQMICQKINEDLIFNIIVRYGII